MENESKVKIKIFGKERTVEICLVGGNDSERLTKEEEKLLKWICSVDFDIHKDKIIKYINYLNDIIGEYKHDDYDLSNDEVFLPTAILINVTDSMDEDTAEVALFAESDKYAIDEGIMIAFKDSEYLCNEYINGERVKKVKTTDRNGVKLYSTVGVNSSKVYDTSYGRGTQQF